MWTFNLSLISNCHKAVIAVRWQSDDCQSQFVLLGNSNKMPNTAHSGPGREGRGGGAGILGAKFFSSKFTILTIYKNKCGPGPRTAPPRPWLHYIDTIHNNYSIKSHWSPQYWFNTLKILLLNNQTVTHIVDMTARILNNSNSSPIFPNSKANLHMVIGNRLAFFYRATCFFFFCKHVCVFLHLRISRLAIKTIFPVTHIELRKNKNASNKRKKKIMCILSIKIM